MESDGRLGEERQEQSQEGGLGCVEMEFRGGEEQKRRPEAGRKTDYKR